jgi:hypothetical protein
MQYMAVAVTLAALGVSVSAARSDQYPTLKRALTTPPLGCALRRGLCFWSISVSPRRRTDHRRAFALRTDLTAALLRSARKSGRPSYPSWIFDK